MILSNVLSMNARAPNGNIANRFGCDLPVVNPPGSALGSLLLGTFVLKLYGISVPVLRVAGGIVIAISGWKLLNEGSHKLQDNSGARSNADFGSMAFYPLTLPLTTGPGTIAVMISLGLSRASYQAPAGEIKFVAIILIAALVTALTIYLCFAYADLLEKIIGLGATDIAVRLSAFILFCLGVQIVWTGSAELLSTLPVFQASAPR